MSEPVLGRDLVPGSIVTVLDSSYQWQVRWIGKTVVRCCNPIHRNMEIHFDKDVRFTVISLPPPHLEILYRLNSFNPFNPTPND